MSLDQLCSLKPKGVSLVSPLKKKKGEGNSGLDYAKVTHHDTDNNCTNTNTLHTKQPLRQQWETIHGRSGTFAHLPNNPIRKKKKKSQTHKGQPLIKKKKKKCG